MHNDTIMIDIIPFLSKKTCCIVIKKTFLKKNKNMCTGIVIKKIFKNMYKNKNV